MNDSAFLLVWLLVLNCAVVGAIYEFKRLFERSGRR